MKLQVKWQDLDMSRSSIMGLFDGKYINAVSQLGSSLLLQATDQNEARKQVLAIIHDTNLPTPTYLPWEYSPEWGFVSSFP